MLLTTLIGEEKLTRAQDANQPQGSWQAQAEHRQLRWEKRKKRRKTTCRAVPPFFRLRSLYRLFFKIAILCFFVIFKRQRPLREVPPTGSSSRAVRQPASQQRWWAQDRKYRRGSSSCRRSSIQETPTSTATPPRAATQQQQKKLSNNTPPRLERTDQHGRLRGRRPLLSTSPAEVAVTAAEAPPTPGEAQPPPPPLPPHPSPPGGCRLGGERRRKRLWRGFPRPRRRRRALLSAGIGVNEGPGRRSSIHPLVAALEEEEGEEQEGKEALRGKTGAAKAGPVVVLALSSTPCWDWTLR